MKRQTDTPIPTQKRKKKIAAAVAMFLVAAAVVGATIIWLNSAAVSVVITNKKCAPIRIPAPPIPFPGVQVPSSPIPPDGEGIIKIPPLSVQVDAMHPDVTVVRLFDIPIPISMPDDTIASLDGVRLVKTEMTLRLGEKPVHTLYISCHQ